MKDTILSTQRVTFLLALVISSHESGQGVFEFSTSVKSTSPHMLCQMTGTNTLQFYVNANYRAPLNVSYTPNTPFVLGLHFDGTDWYSSKDGVNVGSDTQSWGTHSGNQLRIGSGYNGYFPGSIYGAALYNQYKTVAEVANTVSYLSADF